MTVVVDALQEKVRLGGEMLPFALDCRRNTASIALGGHLYEVRPLRWGEKRILSRFAHLGERFLAREFVKVCVGCAAPLPPETEQIEVLLALARWITTPNDQELSLPLDQALLLRVALGVSGGMGCLPADLDSMIVSDVEALWSEAPSELGSEAGEVLPDTQDAVRIPSREARRVPDGSRLSRPGLILNVPDPTRNPAAEASGEIQEAESVATRSGEEHAAAVRAPGGSRLPPPAPEMNRILIVPDPQRNPVNAASGEIQEAEAVAPQTGEEHAAAVRAPEMARIPIVPDPQRNPADAASGEIQEAEAVAPQTGEKHVAAVRAPEMARIPIAPDPRRNPADAASGGIREADSVAPQTGEKHAAAMPGHQARTAEDRPLPVSASRIAHPVMRARNGFGRIRVTTGRSFAGTRTEGAHSGLTNDSVPSSRADLVRNARPHPGLAQTPGVAAEPIVSARNTLVETSVLENRIDARTFGAAAARVPVTETQSTLPVPPASPVRHSADYRRPAMMESKVAEVPERDGLPALPEYASQSPDLMEEWVEQIEQAAEELGIEVGG